MFSIFVTSLFYISLKISKYNIKFKIIFVYYAYYKIVKIWFVFQEEIVYNRCIKFWNL